MQDQVEEAGTYPKILAAHSYQNILVVAPHPDDETQGCAGLAYLATQKGAKVHGIVLTHGDPTGKDTDLQKTRKAESTAAANLVGMTLEFFDLQDRGLRCHNGLETLIQKSITEFKPDLVICTSVTEPHPDHQVTCLAVLSAAASAGYCGDLGFYESGGALIQPTHLMPIDEAMAVKYLALQCFASQEKEQPYLSRIKARDHFRALQLGPEVKAAEAFEIFSLHPAASTNLYAHLSPLLVHSQQRACHSDEIARISVIIRTTGDRLLDKAITSALVQTLPPHEIILVHAQRGLVIDRIPKHAAVRSVPTNEDLNRAEAANAGLLHTTGDFAIFLDEDDYFLPTHLESLHKRLEQSPTAVAALSQTLMVDRDGNQIRVLDYTFLPNRLLLENLYPIHSILFRTSVVKQKQLQFMRSMETLEDWDFWIQLSLQGPFVETGSCTCVYVYANRSGAGTSGPTQSKAHQAVVSKWMQRLGPHLFAEVAVEAGNRLSFLEKLHTSQSADIATLKTDLAASENMQRKTQNALGQIQAKLAQTHSVHESYTKLLLGQITHLSKEVADARVQLEADRSLAAQREKEQKEQLAALSFELSNKRQEALHFARQYDAVMTSHSMKVTSPLRFARRFLTKLAQDTAGTRQKIKNGVQYLTRGDFAGFYNRVRSIWKQSSTAPVYTSSGASVCILTTDHAMYVARLLASNLRSLGFISEIRTSYTPESDSGGLHIVLCAQMFPKLPPGERRIVYQLEQLVNEAWHSAEYFRILETSLAVFEYSRANLKALSIKGISYPHVIYTPLGALPADMCTSSNAQADRKDFLFYGSWKPSQRRCDALALLEEQGIAIKKFDNVFGTAIHHEISNSTAVINIHHSEINIMEAPRVWECISLGTPVISEPSADSEDFVDAWPAIAFSNQESPSSLHACVAGWSAPSTDEMRRVQMHSHQKQLFFAQRAFVATGLADAQNIEFAYPFTTQLDANVPVVLSLPETFKRRDAFKARWPSQIPHLIFDGLRHKRGWIGCALSYRTLAKWAIQQGLSRLIIVEDDVLLPADFADKFPQLLDSLDQTGSHWDVYCGLIAVIDEPVHCLRRQHVESLGHDLLLIDRFKSMVFNVFNRTALEYMANWRLDRGDEHTNTIDMYLDQMPGVRTVVSHPFFVGHATELQSTLWGISNATYDPLIAKTEQTIGSLPVWEPGTAI